MEILTDGGPRVLFADDEEGLRSLVVHHLEGEGFEVESVADGRSAFEALTTGGGRFDVLILDLGMPQMDGFELLRRLNERGDPPVTIVLSGRGDRDDRRRAFDLGVAEFVSKPFDVRALADLVDEHLPRDA